LLKLSISASEYFSINFVFNKSPADDAVNSKLPPAFIFPLAVMLPSKIPSSPSISGLLLPALGGFRLLPSFKVWIFAFVNGSPPKRIVSPSTSTIEAVM